jgi:hypothetical protein
VDELRWRLALSEKEKTESMNHGSTLIAISAWTARLMYRSFEEMFSFGHFDLSLRHCLEVKEQVRDSRQASYVCPSIGHYTTHISARPPH